MVYTQLEIHKASIFTKVQYSTLQEVDYCQIHLHINSIMLSLRCTQLLGDTHTHLWIDAVCTPPIVFHFYICTSFAFRSCLLFCPPFIALLHYLIYQSPFLCTYSGPISVPNALYNQVLIFLVWTIKELNNILTFYLPIFFYHLGASRQHSPVQYSTIIQVLNNTELRTLSCGTPAT